MQCICGADLSSHAGGGRQKRYCSDRCRQQAKRGRDKAVTKQVNRDISSLLDTITTGDCRELAASIPDNSIDMIFTDPPYPEEYLYLYHWLASEAARVLKPGGFLLTYVGSFWKPQIWQALGQHLTYFWEFIEVNSGDNPLIRARMVMTRYKSILAYRKGKAGRVPHGTALDVWTGSKQDKRYHPWGQSESTARYYIEQLSSPGDIVWEPFAGGGTTLAACKVLGRHFIAFELDPATADTARRRLEQVEPLIIPDVKQAELEVSA